MDIELFRATQKDAEIIWKMQKEAFADLLKKYQDFDTSPANEPLDKTKYKLSQKYTFFYIIKFKGENVGAIRVVDENLVDKNCNNKRISPLFVLPKFWNRGIAQEAIKCVEKHRGQGWELYTILQEKGNCYLYEKMGYRQTGKIHKINDKLTLVFYEKR